jgi:hypothetical protein
MDSSYYLVHKLQLVHEFDDAARDAQPIFVAHYGESMMHSMMQQGRQEFEALLFHLPYIGGEHNPLTHSLIQSAWYLALYRVLQSYGRSAEEAGQLTYEATEAALNKYPRLVRRMVGQLKFNPLSLAQIQKHALESQQRRYPDDWVYTFINGDGRTFDYGIDYTECAICKFYHAQKADEFMPYVCQLDYPMSKLLGTGLTRTGTLADGRACCDFRFKYGREVVRTAPMPVAHKN